MKTFSQLRGDPRTCSMIDALNKTLEIDKFDPFFHYLYNRKLANLAEKIYADDASARGRTLDECKSDVALGLLGEIGVAQLLYNSPEYLEHLEINDEEFTGEYFWDVKARFARREFKFEVKYQAPNKDFFSFDHPSQCETAHQNWRKWDIMVGFYVTPQFTIVPTSLVMNEAFEDLYGPSKKNNGTYLQVGKAAQRGQFYQLNLGRRP